LGEDQVAKRVKIGDLFEIPTSMGLAYAQYTHEHDNYGSLIRVFDQRYSKRPVDFEPVLKLPLQFSTFYPLQTAINKNVNEIVAHAEVRKDLQSFPIFRAGNFADPNERVKLWFLWTGDDSAEMERVERLSAKQRRMPILECWNDGALVDAIETGWRPETDPR
jgi:hypothetical protein